MSAVCPACGVAVVPGYAKCPKCHKPLPYGTGTKRARTAIAGGTVAQDRGFPWQLIAVPLGVVIVIGVLLKLIAGGGGDAPPAQGSAAPVAGPVAPNTQPGTMTTNPVEPIPQPTQPTVVPGPDPNAAAAEVEKTLRGRRLWSTIEVSAPRIDVRSGLCDDPSMKASIDGLVPVLRRGGLTRLRCLAQSGIVVFERDL